MYQNNTIKKVNNGDSAPIYSSQSIEKNKSSKLPIQKKYTLTQKGSHNYIARLYIVPRLRTHTHRQKKIKKVTQ